ncbi:MAG: sugar transferase [Bryobacteraceae bacterium]
MQPVGDGILLDELGIAEISAGGIAERAAGCVLLLAAAPAIAASALLVFALSRRSPFVAHRRVGRNGQLFWMLKLRTMWDRRGLSPRRGVWIERVVSEPNEDRKNPADPRVTSRLAAFFRRHSIDELPQLWHVARGEMSLVGPRPLTRAELRHYGERVAELLSVKPGLTGLWQVQGRSTVNFPERAAMDLELVRTLSAKTYCKLLLRTVPAIFHDSGAW